MNLTAILAGIGAVLALGLAIMTHQYMSERDAFTAFRAEVKTLGEIAQKKADEQKLADAKNKEQSDAQYLATIDSLNRDLKRLRDSRTSGGGLRSPTPSPASPDRTCFDPAKLASALRKLDEGILGIVESGSEAVIGLDSAKKWASEVKF